MSEMPILQDSLLEVTDLRKVYTVRKGFPVARTSHVHALDGVSFHVRPGEALGIVGESGCGKSTAARVALRLTPASGGSVRFGGEDVLAAGGGALRRLRRRMQIVFQDPASSLNPRQRVGAALAEPMRVHGLAKGSELEDRVRAILSEVGLPDTAADRFPHEFSGGQRQRIGIARALTLAPELIFADEPVSALDVSVQAQILALMERLRETRRLAFVFISHDLGVVRHACQRVTVMYLGRVVETGPVPEIFERPLHPYTQLLKASSPVPDPDQAVTMAFQEGEPPSPLDPPKGCHFHPRCPKAFDRCRIEYPALRAVEAGRTVACHLYGSQAA